MKAKKTIICRIEKPNKGKLETIKKEYRKAQKYIRGGTDDLYSATKQAVDKYVKKVKDGKKYPLFLRNDTFKVEKIPVANVLGGVWILIKPYEKIKKEDAVPPFFEIEGMENGSLYPE